MNAERAAWAAEAAREQGKFWEMANLLFRNQATWSALPNPMPAFEQYARALNLDLKKFNDDYQGFVVHSRVNNDVRLGNEDHVLHTPTVLLNGREIRPQSYAEFRNLISQALVQADTQARVNK
jgi:protein-disulfide isomerase